VRIKSTKIQVWAHGKVRDAIRAGKLLRQCCERCTAYHAQAHHDDYMKPLEVRWLCVTCHRKWHKENGDGKNVNCDPPLTERGARIAEGLKDFHERPPRRPVRGGRQSVSAGGARRI
jgi:ribosomal protein S27AE